MSMWFSPYIKSPLTDLGGPMYNCQLMSPCNNMEMRAINCMEAYGEELGSKKCKELLEDLQECVNRTLQMRRVLEMKVERERQIRKKLRSVPYADGPEKDSFINQESFQ